MESFCQHSFTTSAACDEPHKWKTIVGVVADVKHSGLNELVDPAVYAPFAQNDEAWRTWTTLTIRTGSPLTTLVENVKKQVWSLDCQVPVSDIQSMDDLMALLLAQQRFNVMLLGAFAGLALLFEVTSTDPVVFSLVAVLLTAVALVACYLPARRALNVSPTVALRDE